MRRLAPEQREEIDAGPLAPPHPGEEPRRIEDVARAIAMASIKPVIWRVWNNSLDPNGLFWSLGGVRTLDLLAFDWFWEPAATCDTAYDTAPVS